MDAVSSIDQGIFLEETPTPESAQAERFETYRRLFEKLGADGDAISQKFLERFELLAGTGTVEDELKAIQYATRIFDYLRSNEPEHALRPEEEQIVKLATMLTDIGKVGPDNASLEQQEAIAEIFSLRSTFNIHKTTLEQFFAIEFPKEFPDKETEPILKMACTLPGVTPDMSMRQFYNMHVWWSLSVLENSGFPMEAALTASTHHLLEGQNPHNIIDEGTYQFQSFGVDRPIGKPEVWVILLDKYDANRTRGKASHVDAIKYLRKMVQHPKAEQQWPNKSLEALPQRLREMFIECVDDMEMALAE